MVHNSDGKVGKVVILPSNGRENIAEERQRDRLAALAEISIPHGDDRYFVEAVVPALAKPNGRERLRLMRAKRKATREAPAIWSD